MKIFNCFSLLFIFLLMFGTSAFAQKDNEKNKYKYRNLSELVLLNRQNTAETLLKSKLEEKFDFISFDLYYSRVRLQFTGVSRPISQDHLDLIKTWEKLQNIDKKVVSLYEKEFLFKECENEFWIPVQKKVSENMLKDVKANEQITLFIIDVGGRKAALSKDYEWLFLSTAFEK